MVVAYLQNQKQANKLKDLLEVLPDIYLVTITFEKLFLA